ncbi:MAG: hypothetical protein R3B84_14405 [Zavarzinella sp.]
MTRYQARSRLHFGMLNLQSPGTSSYWASVDGIAILPIRAFGGVGLMIDEPAIIVEVEKAPTWLCSGPSAERAMGFAQQVVARLETSQPLHVRVVACPEEHTGLGVGTQLGLAVATATVQELGFPHVAPQQLAAWIGRGQRSAIGVHGFEHGGLIFEAGKLPTETLSPMVHAYPFPADWEVKLHSSPVTDRWHGQRELQAFQQLQRVERSLRETETLCRIVLTGLLPALLAHDFEQFSEAVYEFNARSGKLFEPVQGGRYASPTIEAYIKELRSNGIRGVGQSSWGPTVFSLHKRG